MSDEKFFEFREEQVWYCPSTNEIHVVDCGNMYIGRIVSSVFTAPDSRIEFYFIGEL